jgi:eukaryotic-like serine/threonine-protein kinase
MTSPLLPIYSQERSDDPAAIRDVSAAELAAVAQGDWGSGVTRTYFPPARKSGGNGEQENPWDGLHIAYPATLHPTIDCSAGTNQWAAVGGRYLIGVEIGRGGVGVVHAGWDVQLQREVAIKILSEDHRDKPEIMQRFVEEARITSRLQHPGIVAIHELGLLSDNRPFFVMRIVRGETLDQILKRRGESSGDIPRLLGIFLQVCQAIAYAHSLGVIHRDLKPANIMVGPFGVVKVMDWGLAKALDEPELPDAIAAARAVAELGAVDAVPDAGPGEQGLHRTQVGTVFGTPAYLPPEQARGEIGRIDKRADVFGLGSILCEILTGSPPYTGASGREIYRQAARADSVPLFSRLNDCQVPIDLITLAKWCLSSDRDDRPRDANDVVEVLTSYLQSNQRRAEQDLVRFFDLSLDLFCIASTDGYFLVVNENFPRVLGYTAAELTSHPYTEFVHPDDRARTQAESSRISMGAPCVQFLNRYRHADGHYLWLEWNAQAIPEERAIYAVARDVTERVEQAEAHRRTERERRHLAAVVESAHVAIISTALDGAIQSWNTGAESLFGFTADEILGQSIRVLMPPGGDVYEPEILHRLGSGERVEYFESVRRHKDGTLIPVSLTLSPVVDDLGRVVGASKIIRNISERKRAEQALIESTARLRAVVDFAVEAMITIDQSGIIESLNPAAETMFGYPAGEMLGHNVRMLMPMPHRERHDSYLAEYLRTGVRKVVGKTVEMIGQRQDGSQFPIELSVAEVQRAGGRLFSGVVRDISARKQSEAAAAEQLRAAAFVTAACTTLTRGAGLRAALQDVVELAVANLDAALARIWTLGEAGQVLELAASAGPWGQPTGSHDHIPLGKYRIGQIAQDRQPYVTNDIARRSPGSRPLWSLPAGIRAFAGHPLVVGEQTVGVIAVFARRPFSSEILAALHSISTSLALVIRMHELDEAVQNLHQMAQNPRNN